MEAGQVGLHARLPGQHGKRFPEDARGAGAPRLNEPVVHPLAFAASFDEAGAAEICEVAGDFGLALAQDLDEVTYADLAAAHQVEEAEPGGVGKGGEEQGKIGGRTRLRHASIIYGLTDLSRGNIFA
jgi:hypothetical protein